MARWIAPAPSVAPWRWGVVGVIGGVLLCLTLWAPARWLTRGVERALDDRVRLSEVQGSVWEGSTVLAFTDGADGSGAMALPGRVDWRLRPDWTGLVAFVRASCCMSQALQIRWALLGLDRMRLSLSDHRSQWPASLLWGLGTPWNTIQPRGQLQLSTRDLQAQWQGGRLQLQGQLELDAVGMASQLSTVQPMGSYRLTLQGGATNSLGLSTLDGALQLQGQGQWGPQGLQFQGEASASPERAEALSNLLNIIGRREGARSLIHVN